MQQQTRINGGGKTRCRMDTCSTASQSINMDIVDVADADSYSCDDSLHLFSQVTTSRTSELAVDSHADDVDEYVSTPLSTPRRSKLVACDSDTPPLAPRIVPIVIGSLLDAFLHDDALQARVALDADGEAANEPFVDHGWEPPLCAAIRLQVSEEIVELLLRYGASVHTTDVHNRTPLEVLSSLTDPANNPLLVGSHVPLDAFPWPSSDEDPVKILSSAFKKWSISVAKHLTSAGADPTLIRNGSLASSLHIARQNGHRFLVEFIEVLIAKMA